MSDKGFSREVKLYGNPIKDVDLGNTKALTELAATITAQAKSLAPVDLGELKNSIMYKVGSTEGGFNDSSGESSSLPLTGNAGKEEAFVGTNSDHAVYQEFGTRKMYPQPYLRPAVALVEGQSLEIIKEQIDKAIDSGLKAGGNLVLQRSLK